MPEYRSLASFIGKVEWEGGVLDALDYGLSYKELDPEDPASAELRSAWQDVERGFDDLKYDIRKVEDIIEESSTGV